MNNKLYRLLDENVAYKTAENLADPEIIMVKDIVSVLGVAMSILIHWTCISTGKRSRYSLCIRCTIQPRALHA